MSRRRVRSGSRRRFLIELFCKKYELCRYSRVLPNCLVIFHYKIFSAYTRSGFRVTPPNFPLSLPKRTLTDYRIRREAGETAENP